MANARYFLVHLVTRQLSALAGLRALRYLDLQLVSVYEVVRRDTEAATRHLLDRATARVAVGIFLVPRFVFPALACIRASADAVHRNGERLVRLFADRAE